EIGLHCHAGAPPAGIARRRGAVPVGCRVYRNRRTRQSAGVRSARGREVYVFHVARGMECKTGGGQEDGPTAAGGPAGRYSHQNRAGRERGEARTESGTTAAEGAGTLSWRENHP